VPIPWTADAPAYGFSPTGASWLPQPAEWATLARSAQSGVEGSTLELYRTLLAERRARALGAGSLEWIDGYGMDAIAFRNGNLTVIANTGSTPIALPGGIVIASSGPIAGGELPADTTVWLTND
jgi:alpha-glucosidase